MTYQPHQRYPRCLSDYQILDNTTIHLVHTSHKWHLNQLNLIENITKAFPNYQIHLLVVGSKTNEYIRLRRAVNETKMNNTMPRTILIPRNKSESTIDNLTQKYPNILVTQVSYSDIFSSSPLFFNWIRLNLQTRIFAVRVLQVWQFGGLSFDLLDYKMSSNKRFKNYTNLLEVKVGLLIQLSKRKFPKLRNGVVSVDSNGLHMGSKTPCHAFFGNVLTNLRKVDGKAMPRGVLSGPMYTFCKAGVVDREFCPRNILF